ncbi:hypothetical protein GCM10027405_36400 [Arthrobacter alkaliphilus]
MLGIGFDVGPPQFPRHKEQQDESCRDEQFAHDLDDLAHDIARTWPSFAAGRARLATRPAGTFRACSCAVARHGSGLLRLLLRHWISSLQARMPDDEQAPKSG